MRSYLCSERSSLVCYDVVRGFVLQYGICFSKTATRWRRKSVSGTVVVLYHLMALHLLTSPYVNKVSGNLHFQMIFWSLIVFGFGEVQLLMCWLELLELQCSGKYHHNDYETCCLSFLVHSLHQRTFLPMRSTASATESLIKGRVSMKAYGKSKTTLMPPTVPLP